MLLAKLFVEMTKIKAEEIRADKA